mmetsp:Transcript_1756/g.4479  ORF Transcript_1756/g.4479 Transcript_1756/m.4479 type:complete len:245 (+) Transcript_1756:101-835(+)
MLRPLPMFCCGCSVASGVSMILVGHIIASVFGFAQVFDNVVLQNRSTAASWGYPTQLMVAGWCMIGVPLMLSALYGVWHRFESNVRLYLYYLLVCFALDTSGMVKELVLKDPCDASNGILHSLAPRLGEAFLCGMFRTFSQAMTALIVMLEAYCLWVIWSFCEECRESANGNRAFAELRAHHDPKAIKKVDRQSGPYAGIVGLAHTHLPGPYPSAEAYGSMAADGMKTGPPIFGGGRHENWGVL